VSQQELEKYCRALYQDVAVKHQEFAGNPDFATEECGFKILYGPPVHRTPILFIGLNPGFDPKAGRLKHDIKWEQCWPANNLNVTQNWPLAEWLRRCFRQGSAKEWLCFENSMQTNLNFFKSTGIDKGALPWSSSSAEVRSDLERFCENKLKQLIEEVKPRTLVSLGARPFEALNMEASPIGIKRDSDNVCLWKEGHYHGMPLLRLLHPTGARATEEHRYWIWQKLLKFVRQGEGPIH
jgi:hypothetical protein